MTDCCFLTQAGDGGVYSCYPELPCYDADEASVSLKFGLPEGLFLAIIATSRVGPSLFRCAVQRQTLGCADPEFVVAVMFGDGIRSSIGPPMSDPKGPTSVIGAR